MYGKAVGLLEGADVGVNVQNSKLLPPFIYLYRIAFWLLLVTFCVTGSQKKRRCYNSIKIRNFCAITI